MRYPVNNFKEMWNETAGNGFGKQTTYGFHDGIDLNDNGGGNSDLGKEIYAISNGELVYWHGAKHPTTGFGYHSVYKIQGPWGIRWVHQAHCMEDLTPAIKAVSENERIARVGNSGTTYAHIHFAIFKVDPVSLRNGIDTIAKTKEELNAWWEDPIRFIEKYMAPQQDSLQVCLADRDKFWKERDAALAEVAVQKKKVEDLQFRLERAEGKIKKAQEALI